MTLFLILAPYGVFASLLLLATGKVSVFAATAVSLAVIVVDFFRGRSLKLLAAAGAALYTGVGLYLTLIDSSPSNATVKLAVDAGIFVISLGSIVIHHPFTLQYAIEAVPAETAAAPGFVRTNYIITGVWTAAALVMLISSLAPFYLPGMPIWSTLAVAAAARNSAVYFTRWYPRYRRERHAAAPTGMVVRKCPFGPEARKRASPQNDANFRRETGALIAAPK
jgi:hypothetical protein